MEGVGYLIAVPDTERVPTCLRTPDAYSHCLFVFFFFFRVLLLDGTSKYIARMKLQQKWTNQRRRLFLEFYYAVGRF